jgi:hypothetical protein
MDLRNLAVFLTADHDRFWFSMYLFHSRAPAPWALRAYLAAPPLVDPFVLE